MAANDRRRSHSPESSPFVLDRRRLLGWSVAGAALVGIPGVWATDAWAGEPEAVPGGTFTDIGPAVTALTLMRGALGHNAAGQPLLFSVPAGENAKLNAINLVTRELEVAVALPGASGSWSVTRASDGSMYVGVYGNGHLYRYVPTTGVMTDLGLAAAGVQYLYGVTAGKNGKVYAGTYPLAKVIEYDPLTDTFTDFGSLSTTHKYVRGLAYDVEHDCLFAGLFTPVPNLIRINLATGARDDVTPEIPTGTGISEVIVLGGTVFCVVEGSIYAIDPVTGEQKFFIDGATGEQVPKFSAISRFLSEPVDGLSYYTDAGRLGALELDTLTFRVVTDDAGAPLQPGNAMSLDWITTADGRQLLVGVSGNYTGMVYEYEPSTNALEVWTAPFEWVPSPMIQILTGPAATPYATQVFNCAFLNGSSTVYDAATGAFTATPRLGQVENWTWHDDKIWLGIYPSGSLKVWDPGQPASATNPRTVFSLQAGHEQIRPHAVVSTEDRLYIGTAPDYGEVGGALTIMRYDDESYQVFRNIVADQTICSVVIDGAVGFGGSSIAAGTGTDPVATEARLFRFDPVTGDKLDEFTPVPRAASINDLSIGPDGRIWGLADGTLFVFDQASAQVVATLRLFGGTASPGQGELVWHPNGHLFITSQGRFLMVDPLAMAATTIHGSATDRANLATDGGIYLLYRPEGQTNVTDLAHYLPTPTSAVPDDLRSTVHVGEADSTVRNRFLPDGDTLADRVPDERPWPNIDTFRSAFTATTHGWMRRTWITSAERDLLLDAVDDSGIGEG